MLKVFCTLVALLFSCVLGIACSKGFFTHRPKPFISSLLPKEHVELPTTFEPDDFPAYPWEGPKKAGIAPITQEYFRCKGIGLNPPIPILKDGKISENIFDCGGTQSHSLPIRHNKEFIYPILIELANEIQAALGKPVIITSGHRCPQHNRYVDASSQNLTSKHLLGAEMSFYVAGLEQQPHVVLNAIFEFYKNHPRYASEKKAYANFERYEKKTDVATKPWMNKEILIKLYLPHEGRNKDNSHPYAYFSIQVRHDKDTNMRVTYSEKDAQCFHRK
jgi:hypothetical protein